MLYFIKKGKEKSSGLRLIFNLPLLHLMDKSCLKLICKSPKGLFPLKKQAKQNKTWASCISYNLIFINKTWSHMGNSSVKNPGHVFWYSSGNEYILYRGSCNNSLAIFSNKRGAWFSKSHLSSPVTFENQSYPKKTPPLWLFCQQKFRCFIFQHKAIVYNITTTFINLLTVSISSEHLISYHFTTRDLIINPVYCLFF